MGNSLLYRLRADILLTIITLFGLCAAVGILPFAVYRFASGQVVVGVIDTTLALAIFAAVLYAWRTGDTRRTGIFLVLFNTIGVTVVAALLGAAGRDWMYVVLLSNSFLVERRLAAAVSALALVVLAVLGRGFESQVAMVSFLVTASMVSLFAFIFAYRSEGQRLQLVRLATRDALTGAANRRAMEEELQIAVDTRRRSGVEFALVMLDLDHFKRINDQFGHEAGDRVLIALVGLVRKSIRKVDRLFRFGGEEFVLLLPGTGLAALQGLATGLCAKIAAGLPGPDGSVTASLGGAVLAADEDWPSWLARADAAMYLAKQRGRNRAVIDGVDPPAAD